MSTPLTQPETTIGRYEVAGHLATGGMAEILLGRLVGPGGFERPVVIKRILPHLAREASFVEMFLDEARIAAGIRHPNVVQVHELLHEGGDLCLVMEYLEGESLFGLMRRLARRERVLDPALCAHVISQAAAGLHAAHEGTDAEGSALGLVHRDVSPQNIFVCYDGTIKVLDFGIAVVRDRNVRTRTGQLRGKHEYMSPEQCLSRSLDRRSDVFSLGVVLYELSTGHRLFKRGNDLLVLKAVTEAPIPPPTSLRPGYPRELESIALRALRRERSERYQTALELRHGLLSLAQELGAGQILDEALAAIMRELFLDRIDEKRELLRRLRSGSALSQVPEAEADAAVELPTVTELDLDAAAQPAPAAPAEQALATAGTGVRRIGLIAVAAAAVAVAIVVALWRPSEPTVSANPPASAAAAPPASASPEPSTQVAAEQTVSVHVESVPPDAEVLLDGQLRGKTPLELTLPRSNAVQSLELARAGYENLEETLVPDTDQRLRLVLEAKRPPRRSTPARSQPRNRPYRRFK